MTKEDVEDIVNVIVDVHMRQATQQITDLLRSFGDVSPDGLQSIVDCQNCIKQVLIKEHCLNLKL